MPICPHCDQALATLSADEADRLADRRYKSQRYRALNVSYLGLTFLVIGAIWWWMSEPQGWAMPPPVVAVSLVMLGAVVYVLARCWMLWLRVQRGQKQS